MPLVDLELPKGFIALSDFPKQSEYLINLFYTGTGLIRTPGITSVATGFGVGRGDVTWFVDNKKYMVSGTRFIRVNEDYSIDDLGEIEGTAPCQFSQGQVNLVIVVEGGKGYRFNNDEGLLEIDDPDYLPSVSVDFLAGRHYFIPADGSPMFYSEVDEAGNISPLNFIDPESLPDINRYLINISDELVVLGTDSAEFFRATTVFDTPVLPRSGSRVDVGYIGGATRLGNTFAFIGRRRGQAPKIYVMQAGNPPAISNDAVNEFLTTEYTIDELMSARGFRFEWKGFEFAAFKLARHTLAYIGGNWIFLDSNLNLSNVGPWRVAGLSYAYGKYIVSDSDTDNIGILDEVSTEYGSEVEFELQTFIRTARDRWFRLSRLELDCLVGQNSPELSISLALSSDGETYGDFFAENLGVIGLYRRRVKWQLPGGLGKYENYCGIRLRSSADLKFSLESLQPMVK